ncbi:class I SAM-dependent DNA methyltransferase [Sorangium sp. So ce302]|uniref:class I SAM-dependent DNA methyltransferase n=1 Tax=Sorangium sp. So ce302 TaxID=3133297 RepID=UPI003F611261
MLNVIRDNLPRSATRTIVDLGCGTGVSLVVARELGFDIVGVDPCPSMRRIARARGMQVISSRAFANRHQEYAAAIASYLLHLLASLDVVRSAWEHLSPDGIFMGNCHKGVNHAEVSALLGGLGGTSLRHSVSSDCVSHGPYVAFAKRN